MLEEVMDWIVLRVVGTRVRLDAAGVSPHVFRLTPHT
jgi:hypothetical protein